MGCTVDHLAAGVRLRVRTGFVDHHGRKVTAGDEAVLHALAVDWPRQQLTFEWERGGRRETLAFALNATSGPRNGHMRTFFEVLRRESPPPKPASVVERGPLLEAELPPLAPELVSDPARYAEAVERVTGLAARRRFPEAEEQLRAILMYPDPYGGVLESLASDLVDAAVAMAARDTVVFAWLRERATSLWYSWGSAATSGGEGTARAQHIRAAEARLEAAARRGVR